MVKLKVTFGANEFEAEQDNLTPEVLDLAKTWMSFQTQSPRELIELENVLDKSTEALDSAVKKASDVVT